MNEERITVTAKDRTYGITIREGMQKDLPPEWQIIYNDWLGGFRGGLYGTEEASIRLAMIFTNASDSRAKLNPVRWASYGFSMTELEDFVRAGVTIMEALFFMGGNDEEATNEGGEGKA